MNFRNERLNSMFLNEINSYLQQREDLKEISFFTITDVEITDEGRLLKVYFSIFENDDELKEKKIAQLTEKFDEISPYIREHLRKRTKTKFVPNLKFFYDKTPEKADRIEELFKKIQEEDSNKNKQ